MTASAGAPPAMSIAIPLVYRLPLAVLAVWWGARTDRTALLVVAAYLALPVLWGHSAALLVAAIPLANVKIARVPGPASAREPLRALLSDPGAIGESLAAS